MSCEVKKEPHLQAVHARASSGHALQGDALWYRLANFSLLERPPCKLIYRGSDTQEADFQAGRARAMTKFNYLASHSHLSVYIYLKKMDECRLADTILD